jgi:probable rRNA maturation factor
MEPKFSTVNKTRSKIPIFPFERLKDRVLGKNYSLSLAYITKKDIRKLNKTYRKKDKSTNVLSFSLSKTSGEILICPSVVRSEIKKFEKNFKELLVFLFIHGMLHLKGMDHGEKMEKLEKKYFGSAKF